MGFLGKIDLAHYVLCIYNFFFLCQLQETHLNLLGHRGDSGKEISYLHIYLSYGLNPCQLHSFCLSRGNLCMLSKSAQKHLLFHIYFLQMTTLYLLEPQWRKLCILLLYCILTKLFQANKSTLANQNSPIVEMFLPLELMSLLGFLG